MRELISSKRGGQVLSTIYDYATELGLEADIFDLVFEGFWDIYTFQP